MYFNRMWPPPRHQQSGFSLLELLAAVAILACLAILLFAFAGKMRERGEAVRCLNVLLSLGTATHLYTTEHNGYLFRMRAQDTMGPMDNSKEPWSFPGGKLDPYMTGKRDALGRLLITELHRGCPTNQKQEALAKGSYSANRNVIIGGGNTARKLASISRPSQTLLVVEVKVNEWMNNGFDHTKLYYDLMGTHHQGRMNVLWVDGHVSSIEKRSLLNPGGTAIDAVWMGND